MPKQTSYNHSLAEEIHDVYQYFKELLCKDSGFFAPNDLYPASLKLTEIYYRLLSKEDSACLNNS